MSEFSKTKKNNSNSSNESPEHQAFLVRQLHAQFKLQDNMGLSSFIKTMTPTIITGYQGLPILETAKFMAKLKLCAEACLKCVTCESIDKESSVHLKVVRPESGKAIKVDQVRDIIEFLSFKRDHLTIVIIDQAHLMNLQAANAILKTIEEPPENCWILLTSPSIKNMLSTIRSRCLVYKAKPVDFSNFENLSLNIKDNSALFQGRWDWVLKSEEVLLSIQDVKKWLYDFNSNSDGVALLDWMKGRDGLSELILYLRLLAKSEAAFLNTNASEDRRDVNLKTPEKWVRLIDRLQQLESSLGSNVDPKLVEDLLLKNLKDNYVFH